MSKSDILAWLRTHPGLHTTHDVYEAITTDMKAPYIIGTVYRQLKSLQRDGTVRQYECVKIGLGRGISLWEADV